MSDDTPQAGLRLLATLIAADLRAGRPALAEPAEEQREEGPRRGRKPTHVVAIAAHRLAARAA